jgi:hypothetical protein
MSTPPEEQNPYEAPRAPVERRGEKRRVMLFALGVFLVPVAAIIGGYITCWGAMVPAAMMAPQDNYLVIMLAAFFGFLVGAIVAGWVVVRFLRKWMDR